MNKAQAALGMPAKPSKGTSSKKLGAEQQAALLKTLQGRFEANMARHRGITWAKVQARLESRPEALWSLSEMERTGGEPDVVAQEKSGAITFVDCSPESPTGRRSLCYDREAWELRKEAKPKGGSALQLAGSMGVDLLTEEQYRDLQKLGEFDGKTSSWVRTPAEVRDLGGALFCDRRFGKVFVYHNGAESYYAARGFRASLTV